MTLQELAGKVITVETELKQFIGTVSHYIEQDESSKKTLYDKLDALGTRLNDKTSPSLTNYAVWAGVGVATFAVFASLFTAFMMPVYTSLEHIGADSKEIAKAVLVQNDKIQEHEVSIQLGKSELAGLKESIDEMNKDGTKDSDKRLTLVEWQINHLKSETP